MGYEHVIFVLDVLSGTIKDIKVYIQSITDYPQTANTNHYVKKNIQIQNPIQMNSLKNDSFNPSFSGYGKTLCCAVNQSLTKQTEIEGYFSKIFRQIAQDTNIIKSKDFPIISRIYEEKGLKGLFETLCTPQSPNKEIEALVNKSEHDPLPLASFKDDTIMQLQNWGRKGFINDLLNLTKAPRNIKIIFSHLHGTNILEYSINKNSEMVIRQQNQFHTIENCYYSTTGNRKKELFNPDHSYPEITYYKPDGQIDHLKTILLGSIPFTL